MSEPNYDDLDPGIRELVRLLRSFGFDTTDSGDGVSKYEDAPEDAEIVDGPPPVGLPGSCAEPVPNVYICSSKDDLIYEAERLLRLLKDKLQPGVLDETYIDPVLGQEVPRVMVEASYSPLTGSAILSIHGVRDADLCTVSTE